MAASLVKSQFRVVGFYPARPALDALEAAGGLTVTECPAGLGRGRVCRIAE